MCVPDMINGKVVKIFQTAGDRRFKIIDVPGVEDAQCSKQVSEYIDSNKDCLFPLMLVDMAQGTTDLKHFDMVKKLKKDYRDLDMTVILTKFSSGWNGEFTMAI